jgi:uncharacterized damage-inducible protein DinB
MNSSKAQELAKNYRQATQEFLAAVKAFPASDLDKQNVEGWSPRQIIAHLADSEAVSYTRLRRLVAQPGTEIQGYDENIWAQNPTLGYQTESIESALAVFTAVREASYLLLNRLSDEQLQNTCVHSESGPYTIENWANTYTNHPLDHTKQMKAQI